MNDELIELLAVATHVACTMVTTQRLTALQACVNQASEIPAGFSRDHKAAAHAQIFNVLADAACDPDVASVLNLGAGLAYDLIMGAGRAADSIVANSRKRMLAYLRAGDADEAALEMEKHLRVLFFMCRLAQSQPKCVARRRYTDGTVTRTMPGSLVQPGI